MGEIKRDKQDTWIPDLRKGIKSVPFSMEYDCDYGYYVNDDDDDIMYEARNKSMNSLLLNELMTTCILEFLSYFCESFSQQILALPR